MSNTADVLPTITGGTIQADAQGDLHFKPDPHVDVNLDELMTELIAAADQTGQEIKLPYNVGATTEQYIVYPGSSLSAALSLYRRRSFELGLNE